MAAFVISLMGPLATKTSLEEMTLQKKEKEQQQTLDLSLFLVNATLSLHQL